MELTEFLEARIAEDEELFHQAAEAHAEECRMDGIPDMTRAEIEEYWLRREDGKAVTAWPRYLADCEAKRAIVEELRKCEWIEQQGHHTDYAQGELGAYRSAVKRLALAYADHPDYRDEWRP